MAEPNDGMESQRGDSGVDAEVIRRQLEKVLSSTAFHTSERLKNFLRYTVEQSIQGHGDRIKEYSVGTDVFGRGASFDPRLDTIVRTEARKLRTRLAAYYETEGKEDPLRIEFRKGSYAPLFVQPPVREVTATESSAAAPLPETPAAVSVEPSPNANIGKYLIALAAVVLLGGTIVGATRYFGRPVSADPETPSVVVLPFLNVGDDSDGNFFSDGLTDELIDSLGRVPGLHVIARTSAFQYKGQTVDIRKIGRELNVRSVLEGTVRRAGKQLRITVELDDAVTGYRVWSESYDRELEDALSIQREISQSITAALGVRLSAGVLQRLDHQKPLNPEAHQAYLRGRFFWNKLDTEDINTAIGYFEKALSIEPNYAPAYEGLAHCYTQMPVFTPVLPSAVIPKIRTEAAKALDLDPSLGEAHLDLAVAYDYDFAWADAEREFRKGLELNPGDAVAHRLYSVHLLTTGRVNDAIEEDKIGMNLDPVSPFTAQGLARSLYFARRYGEAIEQFQKALALDPNFRLAQWGLGSAYISNKMYSQGMAELQPLLRFGIDSSTASRLGYAYAVTGDTSGARKLLAEMERSKYGSVRGHDLATVYLGLGDNAHALDWLEKAVNQKESYLYLKVDPAYDPLRSNPRFHELLRRMGL